MQAMLENVIHKIQSVFNHQNPAQNDAWMDTLSAMSDADAMMEIKERLRKIDFTVANHLAEKIDTVLNIDEKAHKIVKQITHNYIISLKNSRSSKNEVEQAVYEYSRQLFVNYTFMLDVYQAQSKVKLTDEKVSLIIARLLNAAFIMCKWRYFDDQPAPIGTWSTVHKVIKSAENLAIMNKNLFLYDYQMKETSIASILKRGFMMSTLQKGNFTRAQIEITDQILKAWATNPLIISKYKQDRYQFQIILEADCGPERVRVIEKYRECRYWRTTRLLDLMEAYICAVDTNKSLAEFDLDGIAPSKAIVILFKKLRAEWCVEGYNRQRRHEDRTKKHQLLNVSYGVESICQRVYSLQERQAVNKPEEGNFTFDLRAGRLRTAPIYTANPANVLGQENWWMVDESNNGFAVDFGSVPNDWVEPGILIGYTPSGEKGFISLAEIKSVRKQKDGTYRAGLELLALRPVAIEVSRIVKKKKLTAVEGYEVDTHEAEGIDLSVFLGLLIQKENVAEVVLIIPNSEYQPGSRYSITLPERGAVLHARRLLSRHRNWVSLEFKA